MATPTSNPDDVTETLVPQAPPTLQPGSDEVAETLAAPPPGPVTHPGRPQPTLSPASPDVTIDFPSRGPETAPGRGTEGRGPTTDFRPYAPETAPDLAAESRGRTTDLPAGAVTAPRQAAVSQIAPTGFAETIAQSTEHPASVAAAKGPRTTPAATPERYILKNFHAKGGMGEVWLALDGDIGREVALKRMRPGHDHQRDRFLLEAQITGQLEHPGVVPVHELGTNEAGQPFYVMKFVRGRTLEKAIKEYHATQPTSDVPREVQQLRLLEVFVDLCQTVAYAHSRGVLHRDLKPDNVMLGEYGETLVLDWGLAKVLGQPETVGGSSSMPVRYSGETQETQAGTVQGTPSYMAPEVAEGHTDEVDQRSDVYLLGGCLYQILTGKRPRKGDNLSEVIEMARKRPPVPPRKVKPEVPRALEAICMKALAHRKQDRYQTAQALADDMHRYQAGEPVSAYREPFWERAWRWARKNRRAIGVTLAAAAVLIAALVGYSKLRDLEREREEARQQAAEAQRQAEVLNAREQAGQQVREFRQRADEGRFYLASLDPVAEQCEYYDIDKGEANARAALAVAQSWGPKLDELVLTDQQAPLREEVYDLLLLLVQAKGRRTGDAKAPEEMSGLLDRAALLREPSRGYYRLRAATSRLTGNAQRAAQEQRQAEDPKTPATALDYFLRGEQFRTEAAARPLVTKASESWQPNEKLVEQAMEQYRLALKLNPDHYWSHFQLGRCYQWLGKGAEAVEALGTCVALQPKSPWGYSVRASAFVLLERFADAEEDLTRALTLNPALGPPRLNRGVASWRQKKYEAALKDFDELLTRPKEKRLIEAAYFRAQVYLDQGELLKAQKDLDLVVAENPSFGRVYQLRALIHFGLGEDKKGLEDLNAYLARGRPFDVQTSAAYEQRGRLLYLLIPDLRKVALPSLKRNLLLAEEQLQKAVDRGARSAELFVDLGLVRMSLGRAKEAIAAYTQGLEGTPKDVKLLVNRGWAYEALRQYDKARDSFAAAVAAKADHAEAHAGLAYIQACRQASVDARVEANRATLLGGGDYIILHNVACTYAELAQSAEGQTKEYEDMAIDQLRRAVELWKRKRTGPDEIEQIKAEGAFRPALRARPEFKELLK